MSRDMRDEGTLVKLWTLAKEFGRMAGDATGEGAKEGEVPSVCSFLTRVPGVVDEPLWGVDDEKRGWYYVPCRVMQEHGTQVLSDGGTVFDAVTARLEPGLVRKELRAPRGSEEEQRGWLRERMVMHYLEEEREMLWGMREGTHTLVGAWGGELAVLGAQADRERLLGWQGRTGAATGQGWGLIPWVVAWSEYAGRLCEEGKVVNSMVVEGSGERLKVADLEVYLKRAWNGQKGDPEVVFLHEDDVEGLSEEWRGVAGYLGVEMQVPYWRLTQSGERAVSVGTDDKARIARMVNRVTGSMIEVVACQAMVPGVALFGSWRLPYWRHESLGLPSSVSVLRGSGAPLRAYRDRQAQWQLRYHRTLRVHVPGAWGLVVAGGER